MLQNDIKKLLPSWILNSSTYSVSITDLEGKYICNYSAIFKKKSSC